MEKKKIALVLIMMVGIVLFTGCAGSSSQPSIKSPEEASKAVSDVSTDIEGVASTLEEIDNRLG